MSAKLIIITSIVLLINASADPNVVSQTSAEENGILGFLAAILILSVLFIGLSLVIVLVAIGMREEMGLGPLTEKDLMKIFSQQSDIFRDHCP